MQKIEITGNLGADAEFRSENGSEFVTFSVGVTERFRKSDGTEVETTTWHSCVMGGSQEKLLPWLKRGSRVFVRGDQRLRVFNSAKNHCMMAGSSISVREVELLGAKSDDVPRQLCDGNGIVFDVVKCYWVRGFSGQSEGVLVNPRRVEEVFRVDANGFVVLDGTTSAASTDASNTRVNTTKDEVY